jgi:ABC-type nitrate/sulfonate/bicarbonate transport system substrate-binding protein
MKRHVSYLKVAAATVAALSLAVTTGCSRPAEGSTKVDASGPVKIAVGIDTTYAPYFVAEEEDMFKKAGVDVELIQFGRGGEAVDALAAGQVHLAGSSDATTITQFQQSPELIALFATQTSGEYVKVVLRNGIEPENVKNMVVVPGLSEIATAKYLEAKGIDAGSVEFITATPNDASALLKRGDADGFVMWEPWPSNAVAEGAGTVAENTGDYDWFYNHWVIGRSDFVTARDEEAQKVASVLAEAARIVEAEPERAVTATLAHTKVPEEQILQAIDQIDYEIRSFTGKDLETGNTMADYFVGTGVLKEKPELDKRILVDWVNKK